MDPGRRLPLLYADEKTLRDLGVWSYDLGSPKERDHLFEACCTTERVIAEGASEPQFDPATRLMVSGWLAAFTEESEPSNSWRIATIVLGGVRWRLSVDRRGADNPVTLVSRAPLNQTVAPASDSRTAPFADLGPLSPLTPREIEVLAYFSTGTSVTDIADRFQRSVKTIKRFRDGLASKLGIGDRTQIALFGSAIGMTPEWAYLPRVRCRIDQPLPLDTFAAAVLDRLH